MPTSSECAGVPCPWPDLAISVACAVSVTLINLVTNDRKHKVHMPILRDIKRNEAIVISIVLGNASNRPKL